MRTEDVAVWVFVWGWLERDCVLGGELVVDREVGIGEACWMAVIRRDDSLLARRVRGVIKEAKALGSAGVYQVRCRREIARLGCE